MSEYAAANNESLRAQNIRNQYIDKKASTIEQLKRLDRKVKAPGKVVAAILGSGGSLLLGAGMSTVMVWEVMGTGIALGIPGMVIALLSYPVYNLITRSRKKKYVDEIFRLSGELID